MAEVLLERIGKRYPNGVEAVRDVNLRIADGEFVVLVGPSGCGKSTTLRMVAGLEEITTGQLSIGGRVVNSVAPKDRDVAMVFQNYALYPHMTVFENMAFGLKLRHVPRPEIEQRVRAAAEKLGIGALLDRRPAALSGGQRQRVAVGRAIVREPKVFLFDEPLSNLDAKLRVETRAELKRLHRQLRATTVYVTHDQEEAMTLGDRIVVMKDGIVQQVGSPLEVYGRPTNRFVAGFVGTPPMNFLDGVVDVEPGGMRFRCGPVSLRVPPMAGGLASGMSVTLGVRPEGIALRPEGRFAGLGNTIDARVRVTEPLGDKMDLVAALPDGIEIVARVDADPSVHPDDELRLHVDSTRLHLFERGAAGRSVISG